MKYFLFLGSLFLFSCQSNSNPDHDDSIETPHIGIEVPKNLSFNILNQYPHDTSSYTQGLEIFNGKMYEGTGDYQNSALCISNWKTGKIEKKHIMGTTEIFGEGITIFNHKLYQLTWQNHKVYLYDIKNMELPQKTFDWPYEGWGITNNGKDLIVSDGSANLYYVDPENFKVKNTVSVRDNNGPISLLNELEYVDGFVYANVYTTDLILKIDAESGHVVGKLNFKGLLQTNEIIPDRTDVLNGIAYDSTTKNFLITGKRWPKLFEVKFN
jgi:glutamine cyclotransferase